MTDTHAAATTVEIVLVTDDRSSSLVELQQALDTLRTEGIADTVGVHVHQFDERIPEEGVDRSDQRRRYTTRIQATRPALIPEERR